MPTIDPTKLPPEITSKYSIVSNAFRLDKIINPEKDIYKNEPKDEINVEIGDSKQTEFYPQIKLMRWTNETNFSVHLKDTEYEKATITTDKDKIIWDKDNIKIEFFDYAEGEGGHKMVWYLKSKPLTNKVEFSLQSKGLDFFRQPPLTEEYQNGYSEEFKKEIVVSETQVKDLEGNVLVERPENVVGSYAVYHQTKGGMNDINGKEYRTGQAFFIYKSHITDAEGKQTWAILNIDTEKGIFSEEISQKFLDEAIYPLRSNLTFGFTSIGTTDYAGGPNYIIASIRDTPAQNGNVNSVSLYTRTASIPFTSGVYNDSTSYPGTLLVDTAEGTSVLTDWVTLNTDSSPAITAGTYYWLGFNNSVQILLKGSDLTGGTKYKASTYVSGTLPNFPASASTANWKFSIYATYTPAGGGGPANLKTYNTNAKANIKSIDTNLIANVKTLNTNA